MRDLVEHSDQLIRLKTLWRSVDCVCFDVDSTGRGKYLGTRQKTPAVVLINMCGRYSPRARHHKMGSQHTRPFNATRSPEKEMEDATDQGFYRVLLKPRSPALRSDA
jgi:hypothetical protein